MTACCLKLTRFPARSPLPIAALPSVWPTPSSRLFEQLPQILKHGVFFVRARAIGKKELLAQLQCLSLHCSGIKPILYRSQELISVPLIFCRVPCVTNRSHIELIERCFRVPIELRDRIRDQPVLCEEDQVIGVHAIV